MFIVEKCKKFLREYTDDLSAGQKYMSIIQELAHRRERVLLLEMDDLHSVSQIILNFLFYILHFSLSLLVPLSLL
jgi:hypothetical protein